MTGRTAIAEQSTGEWGACRERLSSLREYVRSSLQVARVLLDEVLDPKFSEEDPEQYRKLASKATGELAMLLRLAHRALPAEEDRRTIRELAHDLAPHARAPRVLRSLLMRPSRATMYALAHFCLEELEVRDEAFDRVARAALQSSARNANERVPYRMLDAAWTRHIAFGRDEELQHPAISLSPLGAGVDLLEATTEDAYAFTHALPYASDFGRVPLPGYVDREYLVLIAEAVAAKALDEDDLDLLAEVLMAPAILRLPWTPTLSFAWQVMERAWNEFGFVPGPGIPAANASETRTQKVRRVLGTVYHTCFASGLCCATILACGAVPPPMGNDEIPAERTLPAGNGAMWRQVWRECSRSRQESLRFLTLAFELRRAIEALDFVGVRAIVGSAAQTDLLGHPLFTQALELLERASQDQLLL